MRLQVGGAVSEDALYAERAADRLLPRHLADGDFCYVLAPRQMGKSSLRIRTARRLRSGGIRCGSIDLSTLGATGLTSEAWYLGWLEEITDELGLTGADPARFWREHASLVPIQRWLRYLRDVVLDRSAEGPSVVLFVDEIDTVLSLPFRTDDLFAAIRTVSNRRTEVAPYRRLTFCLLGVASPTDLMRDPERTPFNVGRAVRLDDFTADEARAFLPGLAALPDPAGVLARCLAWTSGHPYMTARLCDAARQHPDVPVDELVASRFLHRGPDGDINLATAAHRLAALGDAEAPALSLYLRVLGGSAVAADERRPHVSALLLAGMVASRVDGTRPRPVVRNAIFARTFDERWVRERLGADRLRTRAHRWDERGRPDAGLLDGPDLQEALVHLGPGEPSEVETAYVLRSMAQARRRDRRRFVTGGLIVAVGLLCALLAVALAANARIADDRARLTALHQAEQVRRLALARNGHAGALRHAVAALGYRDAAGVLPEATQALAFGLGEARARVLLVDRPPVRAYGWTAYGEVRAVDAGGTLYVWPPASVEPLRTALGVEVIDASLGDADVLVLTPDGHALRLDPSGRLLDRWDGPLTGVAHGPDGAPMLASSGRLRGRGPVVERRERAGGPLSRVVTPIGEVVAPAGRLLWAVAFADDRVIATATSSPRVGWDDARIEIAGVGSREAGDQVNALAYSAPLDLVVAVTDGDVALVFDRASARRVDAYRGHRGEARDVVLSPDGLRALTLDDEGRLSDWSLVSGQARWAGRADGRIEALGFRDGAVWFGTEREARRLDLRTGLTTVVDATRGLAAVREDALVWLDEDGLAVGPCRVPGWVALGDPLSADGGTLVTTDGARLFVTDLGDCAVRTLEHPGGSVEALVVVDDGVVTGDERGTVRVLSGTDVVERRVHRDGVVNLRRVPGGFVSMSDDGTAALWRGDEPPVRLVGHAVTVRDAAMAGDEVVTGSYDGTIRIWDPRRPDAPRELTAHHGLVRAVAASPDGRFVATAGDDWTVVLWRVADGAMLARFDGHAGIVRRVAFSPDGRWVATGGDAGRVLVLPGSPEAMLELARERLRGRNRPDGR